MFIQNRSIEEFTVAEMADAARKGDLCALEAFDICARMLGRGLAVICDILDPDAVVIGSVYARCIDLLEEKTMKYFKCEVLQSIASHVKILPALLGDSIGDVAAIAVAMEE